VVAGLSIVRENIYTRNDVGHLNYQRDAHQVHRMVSHLTWCPTRRSKGLGHQVGKRCEDLLRQQGDETGWTMRERAVQPDRVHRLVRVWPSVSAAEVVNECVVNEGTEFSPCTYRKGFSRGASAAVALDACVVRLDRGARHQ
jgi:hypothetical protein